jgi:hypothetical protein
MKETRRRFLHRVPKAQLRLTSVINIAIVDIWNPQAR